MSDALISLIFLLPSLFVLTSEFFNFCSSSSLALPIVKAVGSKQLCGCSAAGQSQCTATGNAITMFSELHGCGHDLLPKITHRFDFMNLEGTGHEF